ncbi:MAG TPA: PHB depolymerase family esterase, partial [Myxococcales bacterium]
MKTPRTAAAACALLALGMPARAANPLSAYDVDPATVSVSGLSSGGFMAAQLGVAYSNTFRAGFGVFAGGPYDCARNQNYTACMYNATPSISTPVSNMRSWSGSQIDSTGNLASRRIYLWVGSSDTTVGPNVESQLRSELGNFDTAANVSYVTTSGAAHTFPTDFTATGDNSCSSAVSPYISNCGYDGAGAALRWMYGALNARNNGALGGSVVPFDQTAFVSGNGMDATGYLYVPAACAPGGTTVCKLHVALHGCLQSYSNIQMQFVNNTGYNKWADTNAIVILYPQAKPDNAAHATWASGSLANPNGCWDWIGWYGSNADQHGGVQMAAIVAMVNRITSGFAGGGSGGNTVPAAPTGLAVTGVTSSSASLSWSSSPGATSYSVYRGSTRVGSGVTSTSYTDSGLSPSTTYSYSVTAVNSAGESSHSSTVSATTSG